MIKRIEEIINIPRKTTTSGINVFISDAKKIDLHLFNLKSYFSYIWLLDIQLVVNNEGKKNLRYFFIDVESGDDFFIKFEFDDHQVIKSITHLWRNASALEQKLFSIHGINFNRDYTRIFDDQYDTEERFEVALNGDRSYIKFLKSNHHLERNLHDIKVVLKNDLVKKCEIMSGFYHIGFEKIMAEATERKRYQLAESYFQLKYIFWTFLMAKNFEDANSINLSDRSKAIRMILTELERVQNHLIYFFNLAREYQIPVFYDNCKLWIKAIQSLFISYTGNEFGTGVIRPGGLIKDISQVWITRTGDEIVRLEKSIWDVYKSLILKDSIKGEFSFPLISKKLASSWSLSGPVVRAVGVNLDLRKLKSYYFYNDIEFEVPVGTQGKAFDLILIKMEEILQSLKIIIQVLDNLPTGSVMVEGINEFARVKMSGDLKDEEEYRKSVKNYLEHSKIDYSNIMEGHNGIFGISQFDSEAIQNFNVTAHETSLKVIFEKSVIGNHIDFISPLWKIIGIDLKEVEL